MIIGPSEEAEDAMTNWTATVSVDLPQVRLGTFSIFFLQAGKLRARDAKLRAARGGGLVSPAQFSV